MNNSKIKKQRTNIEVVTDYMTWSSPMNQSFVIDALNKLAKLVCNNKDQLREQMKDSMVHPDAWIRCAEEWQKAYDENYG